MQAVSVSTHGLLLVNANLAVTLVFPGSAPVLEKKRKRKPTQKILEYCLEAEASTGLKKKVQHGCLLSVHLFVWCNVFVL